MTDFERELEELLNRHSMENGSNTPDFVLAEYLSACLYAFNASVVHREAWYGRNMTFRPALGSGEEGERK